tara:strand:- start:922 stop:1092 length:171 start_codon:yes stop_codon:yes gene_type:complete
MIGGFVLTQFCVAWSCFLAQESAWLEIGLEARQSTTLLFLFVVSGAHSAVLENPRA